MALKSSELKKQNVISGLWQSSEICHTLSQPNVMQIKKVNISKRWSNTNPNHNSMLRLHK